MEFKGSKTEANLMAAYAGESQARTKYTIYAELARKDGYEQLAQIFDETAKNEKAHAEQWLKYLHGGDFKNTEVNLTDAAGGEHYEWSEMYPQFAEQAKAEGFNEIANKMQLVAAIEKEHEKRYRELIETLKNGAVFQKDDKIVWICSNCGHEHVGTTAPQICPVCGYGQAYFQEKANNY
ncbi:rubrerythrin family protein [Clostridiaceae bacterium NSJ-31]|uniref:Rubrerythrin family protein n=1 Tax=Ligaoa zhengdingensis TaxID=2763658 RepID=A0A926I470_9FIRM|nr:rubrerythrin family protein [Ligaoa zhengdingensis]MBC8547084.1 rubrerythrin family protein [Ligaoa zhengdingensis]